MSFGCRLFSRDETFDGGEARAATSRACSDAVSAALRTRSARRAARVQEGSWNSVNTRGRKRRAGLPLFEPGPPQQSPMCRDGTSPLPSSRGSLVVM